MCASSLATCESRPMQRPVLLRPPRSSLSASTAAFRARLMPNLASIAFQKIWCSSLRDNHPRLSQKNYPQLRLVELEMRQLRLVQLETPRPSSGTEAPSKVLTRHLVRVTLHRPGSRAALMSLTHWCSTRRKIRVRQTRA